MRTRNRTASTRPGPGSARNNEGLSRNIRPASTRLLLWFLLAAALLLGSGCAAWNRPGEPETTDSSLVASASVNTSNLAVTFTTLLDQTQNPSPELFTTEINGVPVPVKSVEVARYTVVLRLHGPVVNSDQVLLSFTNTDNADMQLRTIDQTPVSDFAGVAAFNYTPYPHERYVEAGLLALLALAVLAGVAVIIYAVRDSRR